MEFLSRSFDDHTVVWLVLSSLVGGLVGAGSRFLFEDVLRPRVRSRRDARAVANRYRTPLVDAAESLERRINNLVRNRDETWIADSDYYRLSTVYVFARFLGWVTVINQQLGYLPPGSRRDVPPMYGWIHGVYGALGGHGLFHSEPDQDAVGASGVLRFELQAIGEVMVAGDDGDRVRRYADFVATYGSDPSFREWFEPLEDVLRRAAEPLVNDRLIATGANLRMLVRCLDPEGQIATTRRVVNVEKMRSPDARRRLRRDLASRHQRARDGRLLRHRARRPATPRPGGG